jgi:hypothetical protein
MYKPCTSTITKDVPKNKIIVPVTKNYNIAS